MVSVELKQEKHNALVQFPDDCYSGIVPALYGQFIGCILQKRSGKIIP